MRLSYVCFFDTREHDNDNLVRIIKEVIHTNYIFVMYEMNYANIYLLIYWEKKKKTTEDNKPHEIKKTILI